MEESIEETGWKLVHGDVFRPPQYTRLFVAILGSGVQVLNMKGHCYVRIQEGLNVQKNISMTKR